jgi:hypothetical protein
MAGRWWSSFSPKFSDLVAVCLVYISSETILSFEISKNVPLKLQDITIFSLKIQPQNSA